MTPSLGPSDLLAAGARPCRTQGVPQGKVVCQLCDGASKHIERVAMPYVFKYLAAELAAMNIRVSVGLK
jgi:DNA-directed RNA polymerase beta subunit